MFLPRAPGEAAAGSGGVLGYSGGFGGARIRSCPFWISVAAARVKDLIRTLYAQNDVVSFVLTSPSRASNSLCSDKSHL